MTLSFLEAMHKGLAPGGEGFMITRSPIIHGEEYLLKLLIKKYSHISGVYYDMSDGLLIPAEWERKIGIEKYVHIFLHVSESGPAGWRVLRAQGEDRYRYAF